MVGGDERCLRHVNDLDMCYDRGECRRISGAEDSSASGTKLLMSVSMESPEEKYDQKKK